MAANQILLSFLFDCYLDFVPLPVLLVSSHPSSFHLALVFFCDGVFIFSSFQSLFGLVSGRGVADIRLRGYPSRIVGIRVRG